jgi:hydroxyacylglutathione hydrolase
MTVPITTGAFPQRWSSDTPDCVGVPPFFVHRYTSTFVILRQSGCTNFEKPFVYLILGSRQAMLVDTGAAGANVASIVPGLIGDLPLLVVHSHGHDDHVAGDAPFRANPAVRFVEGTQAAVSSFFGLAHWPDGIAQYDLGDRVLDILAVPGHEPASIAVYDRATAVLLTGDVLYPGRLYVRDDRAFRASIDRLVDFTATRPIAHILGCHIENTSTPYLDYPEGTTFQPDEHVLELGRAHLLELQAALRDMPGALERRRLRDFTIWPVAAR